ncbi:MAG: hypothetical protein R3359_04405 [Marinirhabdus sp.]|nr:hypothetical protein [Marinirhabdus sp.]
MDHVNTTELLFYQKLGELFYAIAASDNVVRKAEYDMLSQLVETQWKKQDEYKDAFDTDAAYQIAIVFEWFDYEQMDADDCFESFVDYYGDHKKLFSGKRKELISKTAQEIADAFQGTNKSELVMLTKLQILFETK